MQATNSTVFEPSSLVALATLSIALASLTGCNPFTAATFVYREVKGATAKFEPVEEVSPEFLAPYKSIRFEPATCSVGPKICSPRLLQKYDEHAPAIIEKYKESYPGGSPGLIISADFLYCSEKGLFDGAVALAHVKIRDDSKPVAEGMVLAKSASFTQGGETSLANATMGAVTSFLEKQRKTHDKDEKKRQQDEKKKEKDNGK